MRKLSNKWSRSYIENKKGFLEQNASLLIAFAGLTSTLLDSLFAWVSQSSVSTASHKYEFAFKVFDRRIEMLHEVSELFAAYEKQTIYQRDLQINMADCGKQIDQKDCRKELDDYAAKNLNLDKASEATVKMQYVMAVSAAIFCKNTRSAISRFNNKAGSMWDRENELIAVAQNLRNELTCPVKSDYLSEE